MLTEPPLPGPEASMVPPVEPPTVTPVTAEMSIAPPKA